MLWNELEFLCQVLCHGLFSIVSYKMSYFTTILQIVFSLFQWNENDSQHSYMIFRKEEETKFLIYYKSPNVVSFDEIISEFRFCYVRYASFA